MTESRRTMAKAVADRSAGSSDRRWNRMSVVLVMIVALVFVSLMIVAVDGTSDSSYDSWTPAALLPSLRRVPPLHARHARSAMLQRKSSSSSSLSSRKATAAALVRANRQKQNIRKANALKHRRAVIARAKAKASKGFVPPNLNIGRFYHSTRAIYTAITALAATCPHLSIEWQRAPPTSDVAYSAKSLMTVRIDYDKKNYPNKSERALFFFGEHARELISPEVGLKFMQTVCDQQLLVDQLLLANVDASLLHILRTTSFLIFPIANPSGRRISEVGNYCYRVNDRKVDLNRNWGEHWSSESDHEDTYPGTSAWSEAETVILAKAAAEYKPTIFISIHSGSLYMLSPFAYRADVGGEPAASTSAIDPPTLSSELIRASTLQSRQHDLLAGTGLRPVLQVLEHVNQDFCRCRVGAAGKELGYLSPGTCLDYIYNRLGTRYSFVLEIYSGREYARKKLRAEFAMLESGEAIEQDEVDQDHDDGEYDASMDESSGLLELNTESFARNHASTYTSHSVASLPSFALPSFAELSSIPRAVGTDFDLPENAATLFPTGNDARSRVCLREFNPVNKKAYAETVDHWSRALLALVQTIESTRPKNKQ